MAKKTANESPVEIAERTLRELQEKHDRVAAARADDDREMGDVSYKAHSGDTEASKKLNTVVERMLRRDLELKSITSAIMVAQANLTEAQEAEAKAEQRRVALEIRKLAKELREAGKLADEGLAMFADATSAMHHTVCQLSTFGLNNPSALQFVSLGERAVRTVLMDTAFRRAFEHLRPAERQSFGSFAAEWAAMLDKATAAKLNQTNKAEEAA